MSDQTSVVVSSHLPGRHGRRGVALLMTLLVIVLLVTVVGELTTATATQAVIEARRQRTLQHELALDSLLLVMPDWFDDQHTVSATVDLDRFGIAERSFDIGPVRVHVEIRDDAAKLNPNLLARDDQQALLERKLRLLAAEAALDASEIELRPMREAQAQRYRGFGQVLGAGDEVFAASASAALQGDSSWSDLLTLWGNGRVAVRRVESSLLDTVLEDIRPALGRELPKQRPADRSKDFLEEALLRLDSDVREQVRPRLTFDSSRFALGVETSMGGDQRSWYLVCQVGKDRVTMLHRSARTW